MNQAYGSALLVAGLVLSNVVHAHIDGTHHGFSSGLLHPFSGVDHLLAMIAVGVWAAQAGGRSLLAVPAAFVSAMAIGAGIGAFGGALPFAEGLIALSVLVLGLLVAFRINGALPWTLPLIALFALFHGYAHAIEVPEFASASSYFAGVLMATASLHAFGVAAAVFLHQEAKLLRVGGLAISAAGAWLMLGA